MVLVLIGFVLIWHTLESSGKRKYQLRNCLQLLGCGHICGAFPWLMIDVGGPSALWVVSPWHVVLGCRGKQNLRKSVRPHSWLIFPSGLASNFLPRLPTMTWGFLKLLLVQMIDFEHSEQWLEEGDTHWERELGTGRKFGSVLTGFLSGHGVIIKSLLYLIEELLDVFLVTSPGS